MLAFVKKYWVKIVNAILALRLLLYLLLLGLSMIPSVRLPGLIHPFPLSKQFHHTEFLISYRGGYVRRGLLGEILYQLATKCGVDIQYVIVAIVWLAFIGFAYVFVRLMRKNNVCWWIIPLNFTFFGADFVRKDYLCMLFVVGIIYYLNRDSMNRWLRYIAICLLSIILYNLHEAFFFIIGPFATYYIVYKDRAFKFFAVRLLWQVPIWGCFIILLKYHGDASTALAIQNSWHELYPSQIPLIDETACEITSTESNSLTALGWTTMEIIRFHLTRIYVHRDLYLSIPELPGYMVMPFFYFLLMFFYSYSHYIFNKSSTQFNLQNKASFFLVVLFVFVSMSPLFFGLSCDIARLCMYWSMTTMSILFIFGQKKVDELFPVSFNGISRKVVARVDNAVKRPKLVCVIILLFIGSPVYTYRFHLFIVQSVFGSFFYLPYICLRDGAYLF